MISQPYYHLPSNYLLHLDLDINVTQHIHQKNNHTSTKEKKTIFEIMFQNIHFKDWFWSSDFLTDTDTKRIQRHVIICKRHYTAVNTRIQIDEICNNGIH